MTPIADMIERMFSGGIPPEFIVLAVRTLELARGEDPVAERRRAYDRERKRAISGGIPVEKEIPPTPPKEKTLTQEPNGSFVSRPKRVRTTCSPEFEDFWKAYPRTPVMAKKQAWIEWQKLSDEDRITARAAVDAYKAWLRLKPDHAVVHACRFLSQRRFEGFAEQPQVISPRQHHYSLESQQYQAWKAFYNSKRPGWQMLDRDGGWTFEQEWPPGHQAEAA